MKWKQKVNETEVILRKMIKMNKFFAKPNERETIIHKIRGKGEGQIAMKFGKLLEHTLKHMLHQIGKV